MHEERRVPSGALASNTLLAGDPASPALLLLHGAGPGASAASNWLHCLDDLARDFYVVAPDMVGFGRSEYPDPLPTHALSWMGLRIEQTLGLLDELGVERAHVVGNSMGGALALHLLIEAPERFDRVALMGSIGAPLTPTPEMVRLLAFGFDARRGRMREVVESFVFDPALVPDLEAIVDARYAAAIDPEMQEIQRVSFESMRNGMDTLIVPPSRLARMPHEVLLVHGRQDRVVPLETSLYLLQHLQRAELHVLDRCGHWAQTQRWDELLPLLRQHFGVVDGG